MNDLKCDWKTLFGHEDHIRLALELRQGRSLQEGVRGIADDQVLLFGGATEQARQAKRVRPDRMLEAIVITPDKDQTEDDFLKTISDLKESYPALKLSGFSPENSPRCTAHFDSVVVKVGEAGTEFCEEPGWQERLPEGIPTVLTLVYRPEVTADALEAAIKRIAEVENVISVVPLPLGAGDRIPLVGLTTAGSTDVMVISVLRYSLPDTIRVRASWAALGWKVAQLALCYGADELAGWSAAEVASYSGRVRAAARVERQELLLGLEEAGRTLVAWWDRE